MTKFLTGIVKFFCWTFAALIAIGIFGSMMGGGSESSRTASATEQPKPRIVPASEFVAQLQSDMGTIAIERQGFRQKLDESESGEVVELYLVILDIWNDQIAKSRKYVLDEDQQSVADQYAQAVSDAQREMLPMMRDKYGPYLRKLLWEHDVTAKTVGAGFTTVAFTGGTFAANRNIKKFQENSVEKLMHLRFKRAEYRWTKYDDEYTYYTMTPPDDSATGQWDGLRFTAF